jgi:hypothetical protein
MQASAVRYALTYATTLKLQLVIWNFVGLTDPKFKLLILPMLGFSLYNTNIWIYMV